MSATQTLTTGSAKPCLDALYVAYKRLVAKLERFTTEEQAARLELETIQDKRWSGGGASADELKAALDAWNVSRFQLTRIRQALAANQQARRQALAAKK